MNSLGLMCAVLSTFFFSIPDSRVASFPVFVITFHIFAFNFFTSLDAPPKSPTIIDNVPLAQALSILPPPSFYILPRVHRSGRDRRNSDAPHMKKWLHDAVYWNKTVSVTDFDPLA